MTNPLKQLRTLAVKVMNLRNNFLSFIEDYFIGISKFLSMSCSSICQCCFIKFNNLFCNWFFISNKRNDIFEKNRNRLTCQFPKNLIRPCRIFGFPIDKMTRTTKSFFQPIKNWRLCVIALYNNFKNSVRSIARFVMLNTQMAFCIYKTSKVNKIFSRWFGVFLDIFKNIKIRYINKIYRSLFFFKFVNYLKSSFSMNSSKKGNEQFTLILFFNKKRKQFFSKFRCCVSFFDKVKTNFIVGFIFVVICSHITMISANQVIDNIKVSRYYNKTGFEFFKILSDRKTPISVGITSKINNVVFFIHDSNHILFKLLKQQFSDNPTEMARSDVDGTVQALQGNDGEFVEKLMEGKDMFGTAPLRDSYLALCHTDMIGQLENVAGFINKAQYPNPNGSKNMAEWGSIGNTRWFTSSRGSITANDSLAGADVYNCFFVAQESYSSIELDGGTVSLFYHPAGHSDDPCHLRQTLGFRMTMGTNIDNDAWILNLRATLA